MECCWSNTRRFTLTTGPAASQLLPFPHFLHVGYQEWLRWQQNLNLTIPVFGAMKMNIKPRVIVYNIENSGADGKYTVLYNLLANNSKVAILVHTADEFGGSTRKWKYGEVRACALSSRCCLLNIHAPPTGHGRVPLGAVGTAAVQRRAVPGIQQDAR